MSIYEYFENYDMNKYQDIEGNHINYDTIVQDQVFLRKFNEKNLFSLDTNGQENKLDVKHVLKKYNRMIDLFYEVVEVLKK